MKLLNSKFLTAGLALLLIWLVLALVNLDAKKQVLEKELFGYSSKIESVKKNNDDLRQFISFFNIPGFLQRQARIKLNYKGPGEEVVYIYRDERAVPTSDSGKDFIRNLPNYKKWWYYMLGY